jgi:hypothetical protein
VPCGEKNHDGETISKGMILRFGADLDGRETIYRAGAKSESHYFIILSHFNYNSKLSKNSCLGVGLSSKPWIYGENFIPEHFINWNAIEGKYYEALFPREQNTKPLITFQPDKVCRLCYDNIEMPQKGMDILQMSRSGLAFISKAIMSFISMDDSDPN